MLYKSLILIGATFVAAQPDEGGKAAAFASTRTPTAVTAGEIREDFEQDIQGELYIFKAVSTAQKAGKGMRLVDFCLKKEIDKTKCYQEDLVEKFDSLPSERWRVVPSVRQRLVQPDKDIVVETRMSAKETQDFESACKAENTSDGKGGRPVYLYHGSPYAKAIQKLNASRGGLVGPGIYMTSHPSKAMQFCGGCEEGDPTSDAGVLRTLVCLTSDNVLPLYQDLKASYNRKTEPFLATESSTKVYRVPSYNGPVQVNGAHDFTYAEMKNSGVDFLHKLCDRDGFCSHTGGEWVALSGSSDKVKIQAVISWKEKKQKPLRV